MRRTDTASILIAGVTTAHVFGAFADAAALMAWLPPAGMTGRALDYAFRAGGRYRLELRYDDPGAQGKTTSRTDVSQGRFVEIEPGHRIVQTVEFDSADPSFAGEMVMTWTFEPVEEGTRVTLRADQVPPGIRKEDHAVGMRSSLENLARHLA